MLKQDIITIFIVTFISGCTVEPPKEPYMQALEIILNKSKSVHDLKSALEMTLRSSGTVTNEEMLKYVEKDDEYIKRLLFTYKFYGSAIKLIRSIMIKKVSALTPTLCSIQPVL